MAILRAGACEKGQRGIAAAAGAGSIRSAESKRSDDSGDVSRKLGS